jgi:integrating conjugative element protein (TIGR03756 family)
MKRISKLLLSVTSMFISNQVLAIDPGLPPQSVPLTTMQILTAAEGALTTNPFANYFEYRVIGVCVWQLGPYTSTTSYVQHYWPDLLISVNNSYGTNPYAPGRTIDGMQKGLGDALGAEEMYLFLPAGSGSTGSTSRGQLNRFFEVSVIGNPIINSLVYPNSLPSTATPFMTYYNSLADRMLWRSPEYEAMLFPMFMIPYVRDLGTPLMPWGGIYPRYGMVVQADQYKAAAVIAHRAAEIATTPLPTHVAMPISNVCGIMCLAWISHENDPYAVKFQMIYPIPETVFQPDKMGRNDLLSPVPEGAQYQELGQNNYVWLEWRRYEGCVQGAGVLVSWSKFG